MYIDLSVKSYLKRKKFINEKIDKDYNFHKRKEKGLHAIPKNTNNRSVSFKGI